MIKNILRKSLPHVVALALFAILSAMFFAPQFSGEALRQSDMIQASGMNQDILQHKAQWGEHPQWAGRMFGGMPAYLIDMNYDGRWVKALADSSYILGQPASWLFIAMSGFYLMLLMFGINPWLGIIGGVAYGFSSYFVIIIVAGHITKMMALAWIAPLIGSVWYAYKHNRWLGALLAGLFAAIEISTSHPQITYYFLFVIIALVINELVVAIKEKTLLKFSKTTAALLLAATLALGANIVQLYYVADHTSETIRGRSELTAATVNSDVHTSGLDKDYALAWSYGKMETLNLLIPNLMGGGRDFAEDGEVAQSLRKYQAPKGYAQMIPSYWGPQPFTEGPVYIGAVVIFLAVFGLFVLRARQKWWLVGVSALAIMLAWGSNMMWFSDLMLDYFPLYNKFRTVSTILVIVEWSMPLLAVMALQKVLDGGISANIFNRAITWALSIVGGICLLTLVMGGAFADFTGASDNAMGLPEDVQQSLIAERAQMMHADALRSLGFILLAAALLWLFFKRKLNSALIVVAMVAIVAIDLIVVDKRYVSYEDFQPQREATIIPMTPADRAILQDTTNYRVANLSVNPWQDGSTSYYHRSVGGYHAAKLRRYQQLIDQHLSRENMAVFSMLNTKYFILQGQDGEPAVQINPNAAGNAWYVQRVQWVNSPDAEIAALDSDPATGVGFNPRQSAVVDRRFVDELAAVPESGELPTDSASTVELVSYKVNELTYHSSSPVNGVVVFSEIYFANGWTAYIDGVEAPYVRADFVLRAMEVPSGDHTIVFKFEAPHFTTLVWITRICSLMLLLGSLVLLVQMVVPCKNNKTNEEA